MSGLLLYPGPLLRIFGDPRALRDSMLAPLSRRHRFLAESDPNHYTGTV